MNENPCDEPRPWTVEDSLALSRLVDTDVTFLGDIELPSGRRLTGDEVNDLVEAERERRAS